MLWKNLVTDSAMEADEAICEHLSCEHIDTESETFYCYDHSVSVRWIG